MELIDTGSGHTDWFLIQIERSGALYAHAIGSLTQVNDRIAEQEYASRDGEEPEVINVWHLGPFNPAMVTVTFKRHEPIGFIEATYTWSQPKPDGNGFIKRRESAYFRIPEA